VAGVYEREANIMKANFNTSRVLLIEAAQKEEKFIIRSIENGHRNYTAIREALDRYQELLTASDALLDIEQERHQKAEGKHEG
jgi:hypothetical protein